MTTIRCSALPRIFACPESLTEPVVDIRDDPTLAIIGTAAHEGIADMLRNGWTAPSEDLLVELEKGQ